MINHRWPREQEEKAEAFHRQPPARSAPANFVIDHLSQGGDVSLCSSVDRPVLNDLWRCNFSDDCIILYYIMKKSILTWWMGNSQRDVAHLLWYQRISSPGDASPAFPVTTKRVSRMRFRDCLRWTTQGPTRHWEICPFFLIEILSCWPILSRQIKCFSIMPRLMGVIGWWIVGRAAATPQRPHQQCWGHAPRAL